MFLSDLEDYLSGIFRVRVNSNKEGNIPSMFVVCNVDYMVDISSSDRMAREHFRFLEHRL